MIKEDDIFRNGVALLAFILAFYALVARERKTPYIVHSVYTITFVVLVSLCLSLAAVFLGGTNSSSVSFSGVTGASMTATNAAPMPIGATATNPSARNTAAQWCQRASGSLLAFGVLYILYKIFRERNRHLNFRDDQVFLSTAPVRFLRWTCNRFKTKRRYEHNPMELPDGLLESLKQSPFFKSAPLEKALNHHENAKALSISAVFKVEDLLTLDELLVDLAARFLKAGCFVQYTSCARHPVEFLLHLESHWRKANKEVPEAWGIVCKKIVTVDGYTPHFGFTDSVYENWTRQAKENCLALVKSKPTFAGIHTAIARAFNRFKRTDHADARTPTLVIYERCAALIDLESSEQYRIFVRHVIPSERLWGGMFTIFVETDVSKENRPVLAGSSDLFIEIPFSPKATEEAE